MATSLIRAIKNTSSIYTLNLMIPGDDPHNPVSIAPLATLDLLTVVSTDVLHTMQSQLADLIANGSATEVEPIESNMLFGTSISSIAVDPALNELTAGQIWFNTTSGDLKFYNGTSIVILSSNPYSLGTAVSYGVLAETGITNTGDT